MYDQLSAPMLLFVIAYSLGINIGVMLTISVTASVYERSLGYRRYLVNSLCNLNSKSDAVTLRWPPNQKKWVNIHLRSCFPLKITVGYHSFFKKATAVATFALIVYATMRMLVIFKKS
jgi:hypothetical protein